MANSHIHHLIVAGASRRPIGIVSSTDFLAAVVGAAREQGDRGQKRPEVNAR